jgi:pilus assembly protein CpaC
MKPMFQRIARMSKFRKWTASVLAAMVLTGQGAFGIAQEPARGARAIAPGRNSPVFEVAGEVQKLDMVIDSTRILRFGFDVENVYISNDRIISIQPMDARQYFIAAAGAGISTLTASDPKTGQTHSIRIHVQPDVREIQEKLNEEFPEASLRVSALRTGITVSGFAPNGEMIPRITDVARSYHDPVFNLVQVGGAQQVALQVQVLEVSRTKINDVGFDFAGVNGSSFYSNGVGGLLSGVSAAAGGAAPAAVGAATTRFGIVSGDNAFFGFIQALKRIQCAKLMAEPTLVTTSGVPAVFNNGGEFPILVPQSLGTSTVQYREFGTRVDFVPIVQADGQIQLNVRPYITERDEANAITLAGATIPALRSRWAETTVTMASGQTLAIAGLTFQRSEGQNQGNPVLMEMPWIGAAFRRTRQTYNEIELLILVTPHFVEAADEGEIVGGPGLNSRLPTDYELHVLGHIEVPVDYPINGRTDCAEDCAAGAGPVVSGDDVPVGQGLAPQTLGRSGAAPRGVTPTKAASKINGARVTNASTQQSAVRAANRTGRNKPPVKSAPGLIGPSGYEPLK